MTVPCVPSTPQPKIQFEVLDGKGDSKYRKGFGCTLGTPGTPYDLRGLSA